MEGSVRKIGNKWYYSFELPKQNGKRKRIERSGGNTKKEALQAMRKAMDEFEQKGEVFNDTNMSVADYLQYWQENYVQFSLKYNTIKNYEQVIRLHINPHIGHMHLKKVKPGNIQDLINTKFKEGQAKQSLSILKGILMKAFNMAVHPWQLIKDNPTRYIEMPKYQKKQDEIEIYSHEDYIEFLEAAPKATNFHIAIELGYHAGLRRGEICGLTWDRVDMEERTLTVDRILKNENGKDVYGSPKTETSNRTIYMGESLYQALRKHWKFQLEMKLKYGKYYIDKNHVLARDSGEWVTVNAAKHASDVISKRTGKHFYLHGLRHTHFTMVAEMGAITKDISERAGHSRENTTSSMYIHLTPTARKKTVALFENGLKLLEEQRLKDLEIKEKRSQGPKIINL